MTSPGFHSRNGFLTAKGLEEAEQRSLEGLDVLGVDKGQTSCYLDKVASVSGPRRDENLYVHDDAYIDSQYRRFHNGS